MAAADTICATATVVNVAAIAESAYYAGVTEGASEGASITVAANIQTTDAAAGFLIATLARSTASIIISHVLCSADTSSATAPIVRCANNAIGLSCTE
jgi:hypothetical protein